MIDPGPSWSTFFPWGVRPCYVLFQKYQVRMALTECRRRLYGRQAIMSQLGIRSHLPTAPGQWGICQMRRREMWNSRPLMICGNCGRKWLPNFLYCYELGGRQSPSKETMGKNNSKLPSKETMGKNTANISGKSICGNDLYKIQRNWARYWLSMEN